MTRPHVAQVATLAAATAAKTSTDAKVKEMTADIGHASYPIGSVGRPTELHLFSQAMIFRYSKAPNAAKAYVNLMMEKEQYEPWQQAAIGYVTQPLKEGDVYHRGALMAGALLGSLPVAVVYSFFVEYSVSGMTGAVKE